VAGEVVAATAPSGLTRTALPEIPEEFGQEQTRERQEPADEHADQRIAHRRMVVQRGTPSMAASHKSRSRAG